MENIAFIKPAVPDGRSSPLDTDNYDGDDDDRCTSLRRSVLHREQGADRVVYLRCVKTKDHPGINHKSWLRSWKTSEENGRVEHHA